MHRRPARLGLLGLMLALAGAGLPAAALAETGAVRLVLQPSGQSGAYFDLVMQPGELRHLAVDVGNDGSAAILARTYAADVYSIVNGGFGARLRDEASTATTRWLTYAPETLHLSPGERTTRPISVSVPLDTPPGEYVTSIVLENDQPVVTGDAAAMDQVIRQAVAVIVTIAGSRDPRLSIGDAGHRVVAGRSVIAVAIDNPGNVRLTPEVVLDLFDATGAPVSAATLTMDSFYAHTSSSVEVSLAALLAPGDYTVDLALVDVPRGASATAEGLPFTVAQPPPQASGGPVAGLAPVSQPSGGPPLLMILAALLAAAALGAGTAWVAVRRRP